MMCSADSWGIGGRDVGSKDEFANFALLIRIALPEVIDDRYDVRHRNDQSTS